MFGKKNQGIINFRDCQNKAPTTVEVDVEAYGIGHSGLNYAKNPHNTGHRIATFSCAKFEKFPLRTHGTEAFSRDVVELNVAKTACHNCMFAKMNPLDTEITLREIAEQKLARQHAMDELRAKQEFFNGGPVPELPPAQ